MTFVAGQVLTAAELNVLDITSLTVDTDTLVVDATNDRVGINQASPSVALDVGGSVVIDDDLTVDTSTLKVDSANNRVGIGTASPTVTLDIRGGAYVDDDLTVLQTLDVDGSAEISPNLTVASRAGIGGVTATVGHLHVASQNRAVSVLDSGDNNYAELGFTSQNSDSPAYGYVSGYGLFLRTGTTRGGLANRIYIEPDGDVGINTLTPGYQLDVNGNLRSASHIDVTSGTNNQLRLTATTTSGRPYLTWNNWNGSSYVRRGYIGYPAAGSATATINLVADNGNVQITAGNGEVNATPKLSINGGPELSDPSSANELRVTTAHGYIDLGPKNSSYCHIYTDRTRFYLNQGINSAPYFYWRNNSGIGGPLVDTSSTSLFRYVLQSTVYGTFWDYTSTRDRKERITNVTAEDSGRWIDALQPVTFIERWLGDEDEPADVQQWREADLQVGFIADDILASSDASHFAQASDDGEGGLDPAGWKWECVIAAAVAEIKSLRTRVASLEDA